MLEGKNYDPLQSLGGNVSTPEISVVTTTGTTPVLVPFSRISTVTGSPSGTITGIYLASNDTTAGNITIANAGATVATIAKGAVAGVLVGAPVLANTTLVNGNSVTVVSSSAGNATVYIAYSS